MWDGKWERSWQWYVLYISYEPLGYDLAPVEDSSFEVQCAHTVPCSYCEPEVHVQHVRGVCVCCILLIGENSVTHRSYRVLRRTHMFGLRVATKPCLQKHLYEPDVFTQRAFLQGLTRTPGSAHSSMSERKKKTSAYFLTMLNCAKNTLLNAPLVATACIFTGK